MLRRNIGWVVAAVLAVTTGGLAAAFVHERSLAAGKPPATTVRPTAQSPAGQAATRLRGKVTAVDATTLTVREKNGTTRTFTLDRTTRYGTPQKALTRDAVKVGETVIVVSGKAQSATPAARRVIVATPGQGPTASTA